MQVDRYGNKDTYTYSEILVYMQAFSFHYGKKLMERKTDEKDHKKAEGPVWKKECYYPCQGNNR